MQFLGKQSASSTHNCFLCEGKSPWKEKSDLMTVGDLRENREAYVAAGQKKVDASKFKNVVNEPLIVAPDDDLLIDLIGVPELHTMTGIATKVMDHVEKTINDGGQDGSRFVKHFLQKENIRRADQRGGKCFKGRVGSRIF